MSKLVSEQLPNDGTYYIKQLVKKANDRLSQIGKRGKRAKIVAKKSSLTLQFTFHDGDGNPQKNVGLGTITNSPKGIEQAESIAQLVTAKLSANDFSWDWYNKLIGKDTHKKAEVLTCKEMVEQFKKHYFDQRKTDKSPIKSWYSRCIKLERTLGSIEKPLSLALIRKVIDLTNNNSKTRINTIGGLVEFLKYFNNTDYKEVIKQYKANNNPQVKKRSVPSDKRIIEVYKTGYAIKPTTNKRHIRYYSHWQFLYGLLATYGLRIHEAWNIANWDKPVVLKYGDWVTVDKNNTEGINLQRDRNDLVIPAILDPNNKDYLLCIKHDTKTGYRIAVPLSPNGCNWIEEFNLLQPLNLPEIKKPLSKYGKYENCTNCSSSTCKWFNRHKYGFTPHDLRHAYNHRGHQLGFNPKALADSLGHSITMNSRGYLRHMSDAVKLEGMMDAIKKDKQTRTRVEQLEAEVLALKHENELLKTKLKMYEAIEESKRNS